MVKVRFPTGQTRKRTHDHGVTLVELLVTMVIAGLVTTSTFMFFAGQKQVYETQTKLLNVQQNLWAAMETLTRNLRAAGTGMVGCVRLDSDGIGPDNGDPPPVSGPGNTPPATGLRAFMDATLTDATAFYGPSGAIRIAPLWIQNGANGLPDSIVVAYGVGTSGNFTDARLASTVPVGTPRSAINTPAGLTSAFRANEFIALVDNIGIPASGNFDRGCTLFQIRAINAGANLLDTTTAGAPINWNPTTNLAPMVPFIYDNSNSGIRNLGQLNWVRFAINNAGSAPVLQMTRLDTTLGPQTLAEGIEDLQVAYACDTRGTLVGSPPDGTLDEIPPSNVDEWTYNVAGDVPPVAGCNRPQAIRVTLIARSIAPDENLRELFANGSNQKPAIEDGIVGAPDMFRHRTISTTVFPRN